MRVSQVRTLAQRVQAKLIQPWPFVEWNAGEPFIVQAGDEAAFVAALSPDVILKLCDLAERAGVDDLDASRNSHSEDVGARDAPEFIFPDRGQP
jgi:hypothetical protein